MLIDTTGFPLVFLREHNHERDHAPGADQTALQALLDRGERFVLLSAHFHADHPEESHEERKERTLFFKRHKARIRELCRGMIVITRDRGIPAVVRLGVQGAGKALGVPVAFVANEQDAATKANHWLAQT